MHQYQISENREYKELNKSSCEKDLGILIDPLLNFNEHILNTTNKARKLCGMIVRNLDYKNPEIFIPLFKSIVRPILEYANCVWSPHKRKDIDIIEKVQRHFTKNIVGMKELPYEERLQILKLPSLEYRRVRGLFSLVEFNDAFNTISLCKRQSRYFKCREDLDRR